MRFHKWLLVAVLAVALPTGVALASTPSPQKVAAAPLSPEVLHPGCSRLYTRSDFHHAARKIFSSSTRVSRFEKRILHRVLHCQQKASSRRVLRFHLRRYKRKHAVIREWHYYRTHPMPACTWVPESGGDYHSMNPKSTAGGKYQMLDGTFHSYGGPDIGGPYVTHDAARVSPLIQERVVRRLMFTGWGDNAPQGLGAWVNC